MKETHQLKILQLNVWTGRIKGALVDFIKNGNFDVICLQEAVWSDNRTIDNLFVTVDEIKEACGFKYDSRASNWGLNILNSVMEQGNVILSREPFENEEIRNVDGQYSMITATNDFYHHLYTIQKIKLKSGLTIFNHHGYWDKNPLGNEETVRVMKNVANFVREATGPVVMCGDLNIIYDSPAMRELDFLTDLTHKYNIDSTLAGLKFNGKVACDHILISDDITVKSFTIANHIVSDHKPLVAEIEY